MCPDRYGHTQLPNNCVFLLLCFFFGDVAFSGYYVLILQFSLMTCSMESTSYVFSFRMVFFLPCDHELDFGINLLLCENSINQSKTALTGINYNSLRGKRKSAGVNKYILIV